MPNSEITPNGQTICTNISYMNAKKGGLWSDLASFNVPFDCFESNIFLFHIMKFYTNLERMASTICLISVVLLLLNIFEINQFSLLTVEKSVILTYNQNVY